MPVGGNSLIVANLEMRMRSPFYPELIQYTAFLDGGQRVAARSSPSAGAGPSISNLFLKGLRWTPGVGVRVFTPVGPFQANVGYNPYPRTAGRDLLRQGAQRPGLRTALLCESRATGSPPCRPPNGEYEQLSGSSCPATYLPPESRTFLSRLTFTFSIGPDF